LEISERRACRYLGQNRSTQRRRPQMADVEIELRAWLVAFAKKRSRFDYKRAHAIARKQGFAVNRKRVQRIWREEGLKVTHKAKKRSWLGHSTTEPKYLEAVRTDHVWALDFQDDQIADGKRLRILNIVDEFTREVLAVEVARSITADKTVEVLEELLEARGTAPRASSAWTTARS
jgi:putative transposase